MKILKTLSSWLALGSLVTVIWLASWSAQGNDFNKVEGDYYKEVPQFHTWPDPKAARYKIKRFGPTGIGLELRQPLSRAYCQYRGRLARRGLWQIEKGANHESINGQVLKDYDPRVILGNLITEAEARAVSTMIKEEANSPAAESPQDSALGAYSDTWPVNCAKSDKIVRACADTLAKQKDSVSIGLDGALMFMLSTGEEKTSRWQNAGSKKWWLTTMPRRRGPGHPVAGYTGQAVLSGRRRVNPAHHQGDG